MSGQPSMPIRSDDAALDRVLARAVLCRALKSWLCRPKSELGPYGLWTTETSEALERAACVLEEGAPGPVVAAIRGLLEAAPTDLGELGAEYDRIYGHSLRGWVCPYETEYGRLAVWQQAHELSDLAGFYAAFGLDVGVKERVDHIACEVEFLELLSLRESWAREHGDGEQAEVAHEATRRFLREHLGRAGPAFARSLVSASPQGFFGRVGALLAALLEHEGGVLEAPLGSPLLEVRPLEDDPVPMACGTADSEVASGPGLVQLGGVGARG